MPDRTSVSVLFVCLGNICRSPLAEGVLRHLGEEDGLDLRVDSAGTGAWHVGEPPDPRSVEVAARNGITLEGRARRLEPDDLDDFDYVIAMDRSNLAHIEALRGRRGGRASIHLLREFDPEAGDGDREVPDPYYGGPRGFDTVFDMVHRSCVALLRRIDEGEGAG